MENYKVIKGYLKTFPKETTVETLLDNITKAEKIKSDSMNVKINRMLKDVGKVYYYESIDDGIIFTKFVTQISGVSVDNDGKVSYTANVIQITEGTIYYTELVKLSEGDLKDNHEVHPSVYTSAKEKYNAIKNFTYEKQKD